MTFAAESFYPKKAQAEAFIYLEVNIIIDYIPAKTLVTKNKSSEWFGNDYNMNIYKGCCHGCIYCDSRSDCYRVSDFDTVRAKENALEILRNDLRRKIRAGVIGTGSMSDPYNPFEEKLLLTRHALELINAYNFGVSIITKSPLITRDIDILKDISEFSPVLAKLTITTLDDNLASRIERNIAPSSERFKALEKLSASGIFAGIVMMPILPFINDTEENVIGIVRRANECGARFVYPELGVTLRNNQREHFFDKLDEHFSDISVSGMSLKQKYISTFGNRYRCSSTKARSLYDSFANECERLGILYRMNDITSAYKQNYSISQLSFF